MNVRRATAADEATLRGLWEEFEREVPEPPGFTPESWEEEWRDTSRQIDAGGVFLAENDDGAVGVAKIDEPKHGAMHVHLVHVSPGARRAGVAKALLRACVAHAQDAGAATISLNVVTSNELAHTVWRRLGFNDVAILMAVPVDVLEARLGERAPGEQRATTHVQTDDELSVTRAVAHFLPRLQSPDLSNTGSWIRIADATLARDGEAHGRFADELSDRLGAVTVALALEGEVVRMRLYERGRMVDEYLSVPGYYGGLSTGDELALAANPTLIARLTGADREAVRRVAVTGASPADVPPALQLYEDLHRLLGLEP
ncbi:MAG TPA: GNAT family N-acetyltransferase [Gaiellaceae bacterium]